MKLRTLCAMDLHHIHTTFEAQTVGGQVLCRKDLPTERRHLLEMVQSVPGPAGVVIEESPMADWVLRTIQPFVAEVVVCDPISFEVKKHLSISITKTPNKSRFGCSKGA